MNAPASITNCIIRNNGTVSRGGGIEIIQSSGTFISGCTIQQNETSQSGGGIYIANCWDVVIQNCLITDNETNGRGGGIYFQGNNPNLSIVNCTVAKNRANEGGGVYDIGVNQTPIKIRNSILWGNVANIHQSIYSENSEITYSDIQGGWPGIGNINTNPVFLNTYEFDYHLHSSSPCIDTGDPTDDYSVEPQPNGGRINMGVYGNTADASSFDPKTVIVTHYVEATCESEALITLNGLYFDNTGTLSLGDYEIPSNDILIWSDTLVEFYAPADMVGVEPILINTSMGSDSLASLYVLTPKRQYVSGEVSGIWTAECPNVYILTGDVTILEEEELVIEPGVTVFVDLDSAGLGARFNVYGNLNAIGTEEDSILFSVLPYQASPGTWSGLNVSPGNSNKKGVFEHCIVEYAETGIYCRAWASGCDDADNYSIIKNCTIRNNSENGIWCRGAGSSSGCIPIGRTGSSSPTIRFNCIYNNGNGITLSAHDGYFSNGYVGAKINNNLIYDNIEHGIDCYGDDPVEPNIFNNNIFNNGKSGIQFNSNFNEEDFLIRNNIIIGNENRN